jgi:hypothetical protein
VFDEAIFPARDGLQHKGFPLPLVRGLRIGELDPSGQLFQRFGPILVPRIEGDMILPAGNGSITVRAGQTRSLPKRTPLHIRHIGFGEEPRLLERASLSGAVDGS